MSYRLMKANVELVNGRMPQSFLPLVEFDMDSPVDAWVDDEEGTKLRSLIKIVFDQLKLVEPYYGLGLEKITLVKKSTGEEILLTSPQIEFSITDDG